MAHRMWKMMLYFCLRLQGINILFIPFGQRPERPPGRAFGRGPSPVFPPPGVVWFPLHAQNTDPNWWPN